MKERKKTDNGGLASPLRAEEFFLPARRHTRWKPRRLPVSAGGATRGLRPQRCEMPVCDRRQCRSSLPGRPDDCNANAAAGEPAACADGWTPTRQPVLWAPVGEENFDCCAADGGTVADSAEAVAFADALESCIREAAEAVSASVPAWADHCESVSAKTALQRRELGRTLDPLFAAHGYTAALWCSIYSSAWPMGWTDGNWYDMYLCPAARACSGREALGEVDEAVGSDGTVEEGETAPIRTMSCALCRRLRARLGEAPFTLADTIPSRERPVPGRYPTSRYQRMAAEYEARLGSRGYWDRWVGWDLHPFGVWLADAVWPAQLEERRLWEAEERIARYRLTNGEVMHGFVWQSLALLAERAPPRDPSEWVFTACDPTWRWQNEGTNRGTCAHGAGHGLFYYYRRGDCGWSCAVRAALPACSRGPLGGWAAEGNWAELCEGGVFHSAFNSLTAPDLLRHAALSPASSLAEAVCEAGWRGCAVNLGAEEGEGRFALAKAGFCDVSAWTSRIALLDPSPSPSPLPPPPPPRSLPSPPARSPPPPSPPPPPQVTWLPGLGAPAHEAHEALSGVPAELTRQFWQLPPPPAAAPMRGGGAGGGGPPLDSLVGGHGEEAALALVLALLLASAVCVCRLVCRGATPAAEQRAAQRPQSQGRLPAAGRRLRAAVMGRGGGGGGRVARAAPGGRKLKYLRAGTGDDVDDRESFVTAVEDPSYFVRSV